MSTESPTGISIEFQSQLRSECEHKLNETVVNHLFLNTNYSSYTSKFRTNN